MSEYRPRQHSGKPQGHQHETLCANVELWTDSPPDVIVLGDFRYRLERTYTSDETGAQK